MSYDSRDLSVQDGRPLHLIQITYEGEIFRYVSAAGGVSEMGQTWEEKQIILGQIATTEELNKNKLDLTFAKNDPFGLILLQNTHETVVTLTVFRGYRNDPDNEFITFWKGRMVSSAANNSGVIVGFESIYTSMRRPGLRGKLASNCRFALYGRGCTLDKDLFATESIVSDISDNGLVLSIPAAAEKADGYYTGGMIQVSSGVFRFIKNHVGDQVTISRAYADLIDSAGITIYPGCDRTTTTCFSKFDNLVNFGGFPYRKTKNPFELSSII